MPFHNKAFWAGPNVERLAATKLPCFIVVSWEPSAYITANVTFWQVAESRSPMASRPPGCDTPYSIWLPSASTCQCGSGLRSNSRKERGSKINPRARINVNYLAELSIWFTFNKKPTTGFPSVSLRTFQSFFSSWSSGLDTFSFQAQTRLLCFFFVTKAQVTPSHAHTHPRSLRVIKNQSRIIHDCIHDDPSGPHHCTQFHFVLSFGFCHSSYSDPHFASSPLDSTSSSRKSISRLSELIVN